MTALRQVTYGACFGIAPVGLATSWRYKWRLQAIPICALMAGILICVLAV
jgi:hypothetical protein